MRIKSKRINCIVIAVGVILILSIYNTISIHNWRGETEELKKGHMIITQKLDTERTSCTGLVVKTEELEEKIVKFDRLLHRLDMFVPEYLKTSKEEKE